MSLLYRTLFKFQIEFTKDAKIVIFRKHYRLPPKYLEYVDSFVNESKRKGSIKPTYSPHSLPLLVVRKKNSAMPQFSIDYRLTNSCSSQDVFPLSSIKQILKSLARNTIFISLDLLDASMHWKQKKKRAKKLWIIVQDYFPTRPQFGHKNVPDVYARTVSQALNHHFGLIVKCIQMMVLFQVKILLNLFLIQRKCLKAFQLHTLKAKLPKCHFLCTFVLHPGFQISLEGISPSPAKIETMKTFIPPADAKEVSSFLVFYRYFRFLIPNDTSIAPLPLTNEY